MTNDLEPYIRPTRYIESDAAPVVELARSLVTGDPPRTAIALFDWVRDEIRYDPYCAVDPPEHYRATAILARRRGYCVQKAVLLAALGRSVEIPTRLGFADVRNHKTPARLLEMMGTDLFVYHGFVELHLDGRWVKATPVFDSATSERIGVLPVTLDGTNDAMLHPVDPEGHPFIEYVANRGTHADLPIDDIRRTLLETYVPMVRASKP
jgi:transglutaminase-like putative cysteine protease